MHRARTLKRIGYGAASALVLGVALTALMGCDPSETLARYGGRDYIWHVAEIDGEAAPFPATLAFGFHGTVYGSGPCGGFGAQLIVPYPWFALEDAHSEAPDCTASVQQQAYYSALQAMTLGEVSGTTLILSNDVGREMVFKAGAAAD